MPFGGRVLEARGLWCSVSERGGRVWKSSVSDRERAREEVRGDEHIVGSGGWGAVGLVGCIFSGYFLDRTFFLEHVLRFHRHTLVVISYSIAC